MVYRALAVLLLLTTHVLAQSPFPGTPPGRLLQAWLDSFNARGLDRHTRFLTDHSSEASREGRPAPAVARNEMRFRDIVGGGFDFYKVTQSSDTELHALLKARSGLGWAEIIIRVDQAKPDVIAAREINQTSPPPEARPERKAPAALAEDIGQMLDRLAAADRFSGVVLMAKDGQPFFQKAYGLADRDKKVPNNLDTRFRLGSMNK